MKSSRLLLLLIATCVGALDARVASAQDVEASTAGTATVSGAVISDGTGNPIPFSTVVTEQFEARKQRQDKNFEETVAKASQAAMGRAWLRLAEETVAFLAETPAPPAADLQPSE